MKHYHLHYNYKPGHHENFSVTNDKGKVIIRPGSGPNDFICSIVEQLLLPEKEQVRISIDKNMPDYYARLIELFEKFYNIVPEDKKPLNNRA